MIDVQCYEQAGGWDTSTGWGQAGPAEAWDSGDGTMAPRAIASGGVRSEDEAMQLCAVIFQEADGKYAVVCPSVPGCISRGTTPYEALKVHREAIALRFATRGVPTRCVDFNVVQGGQTVTPVEQLQAS